MCQMPKSIFLAFGDACREDSSQNLFLGGDRCYPIILLCVADVVRTPTILFWGLSWNRVERLCLVLAMCRGMCKNFSTATQIILTPDDIFCDELSIEIMP